MNWFLTSDIVLLHKMFGFSENTGLTNNRLGPKRFIKSGNYCTCIILTVLKILKTMFQDK